MSSFNGCHPGACHRDPLFGIFSVVNSSQRSYFAYILASRPYGTLYVGVTNGLIRRIQQHRHGHGSSFTRKYRVYRLVWYQQFSTAAKAIQREKAIKEWPRQWKINIIERENPHWLDLYPGLPGVHLMNDKLQRN